MAIGMIDSPQSKPPDDGYSTNIDLNIFGLSDELRQGVISLSGFVLSSDPKTEQARKESANQFVDWITKVPSWHTQRPEHTCRESFYLGTQIGIVIALEFLISKGILRVVKVPDGVNEEEKNNG